MLQSVQQAQPNRSDVCCFPFQNVQAKVEPIQNHSVIPPKILFLRKITWSALCSHALRRLWAGWPTLYRPLLARDSLCRTKRRQSGNGIPSGWYRVLNSFLPDTLRISVIWHSALASM